MLARLLGPLVYAPSAAQNESTIQFAAHDGIAATAICPSA